MALDVFLQRSPGESWGFRLTGGVDYKMPLTVVKVQPSSPAASAGLLNGDTVMEVLGLPADTMTHHDAHTAITAADTHLSMKIQRGRYDPVIDDQENFLPIEIQEDSALPSEPTEVLPSLELPPPIEQPVPTNILEDRSQSASPFLLYTKPYRPFSTEPIPEIPPIEDPIILNPKYQDEFAHLETEEILSNLGFEDVLGDRKYKLPISQQYDPEYSSDKRKKKICQSVTEKTETVKKFETEYLEKSVIETVTSDSVNVTENISMVAMETEERMTKEEVKFIEKMKKEIDLVQIEETAKHVVEESIDKAVTVAEEIKKEVDVELRSSESRDIKTSKEESSKTVLETEVSSIESKVQSNILEASEIKSIQNIEVTERIETDESLKVSQNKSCGENTEEFVASGTVKRLSANFDKMVASSGIDETKRVAKNESKSKQQSFESSTDSRSKQEKVSNTTLIQNSQISDRQKIQSHRTSASQNSTEKKYCTSKLLAEQRAYTIGLKTIPKIRGNFHSSYHYDLLLKTFFIHLTDVMVALSRFILTEPVLSESENISPENKAKEESHTVKTEKENSESKTKNTVTEEVIEKTYVQEKKDSIKQENKLERDVEERLVAESDQIIERKKLTGSEMARLGAYKTEDLTHRMDAVISEYHQKTGIEDITEVLEVNEKTDRRRSRSRSKIEEDIFKENDPLEWLSKVDQVYQSSNELSKTKLSSTTISNDIVEHTTSEQFESNLETRESNHRSKSREGKNIYVGIVESHVYTNKDAILEEQFSTSTSSRNSFDASNTVYTVADQIETRGKVNGTEICFTESSEKNKVNISDTIKVEKYCEELDKYQEYELKPEELNSKLDGIVFCEQINEIEANTQTSSAMVATIDENINFTVQMKNETSSPTEIVSVEIENNEKHITFEKHVSESLVEEASIIETINNQCFEAAEVKSTLHSQSVEQHESDLVTAKPTAFSVEMSKKGFLTSDVQKASFNVQSHEKSQFVTAEKAVTSEAVSEQTVQSNIQGSSFMSDKSSSKETSTKRHNLSLDLNDIPIKNKKSSSQDSIPSTIDTPTPETVPPTPLTDEYVFRLEIPMPKELGVPQPHSPSPEEIDDHEDPHIVKKKLIPHIETTIERIVYDPPLPTPIENKTSVFDDVGGVVGEQKLITSEEEIKEIERKSSLLASAIDETIKSIEEYKEQVGLDKRKGSNDLEKNILNGASDTVSKFEEKSELNYVQRQAVTKGVKVKKTPMYASYVKPPITTIFAPKIEKNTKIEEDWSTVVDQIDLNTTVKESERVVASEISSKEKIVVETVDTENSINGFRSVKFGIKTDEDYVKALETEESITKEEVVTKATKEETEAKEIVTEETKVSVQTSEVLPGFRSVPFNPDEIRKLSEMQEVQMQAEVQGFRSVQMNLVSESQETRASETCTTQSETLGTTQGIISGMEDIVMDADVAKELGKPGLTEDKIAEMMSGESEMLREAHVMGLARVLTSHMTRVDGEDDSSVDFQKIKPTIGTLKHSEVLKALNDELTKTKEEKKKDDRKWTTFLQKPNRNAPPAKFGYHGWLPSGEPVEEPYKVKIVKQPKPKVAPDYKPEDFNTGPLPWEERAATEPPPPPVEAEDPILIPEEGPEFLVAVDPLPESEVPDLEDTGIELPPELPEQLEEEPKQEQKTEEEEEKEDPIELDLDKVVEETQEIIADMEQNKIAEQLLNNVQSMVDPNASLEQQLAQMRLQLAALAQLPCVIQQSLELVTKQLSQMSHQESCKIVEQTDETAVTEHVEETTEAQEITEECTKLEPMTTAETVDEAAETGCEVPAEVTSEEPEERRSSVTSAELLRLRKDECEVLGEQMRVERQKKDLMDEMRIEHESRLVKQHPTPRVGKPKPVFGPLTPQERPLVLPGGRKWRKPKDAFNEQFIAETLAAQAEIIQGKAKGSSFESDLLPYDPRINFLKYEKPPISLDHLKESDTYKLIHNMEQSPRRAVDRLTPVVAECDYREKCRSMTPCSMAQEQHLDMPQQLQP